MERTISVEERIKRAEEIYNKRKGNLKEENIARVNINKRKDFKLLKKVIIQILVCLSIYSLFYVILNNNYIFSQDFKNKAQEIISYDINLKKLYEMGIEKFNALFKKKETEENNENVENQNTQEKNNENMENPNTQEKNNENMENPNTQEVETNQSEENIGGAISIEENSINKEENNIEISQAEEDTNYIKSTINFIKPVEGTISSKFGYRETASEGIPKNHTGTDIVAEIGTKIVSATDGTVILASSQGDYRKTLKNTNK